MRIFRDLSFSNRMALIVHISRHMIYDIIDNMVRVSLPGNYL